VVVDWGWVSRQGRAGRRDKRKDRDRVAGVGRDLGRRGGAAERKWLGFLAWVGFVGVVWPVARVVWWSGRLRA
jgi:hypothetical protein